MVFPGANGLVVEGMLVLLTGVCVDGGRLVLAVVVAIFSGSHGRPLREEIGRWQIVAEATLNFAEFV